MVSQIDPTQPPEGDAPTQTSRDNFTAARDEITALQEYAAAGRLSLTAGAVPTGWLVCNGAAVSRTTYSALFQAIGTAYGIGDGSTTFNVPDLQGLFPIGTSGTIERGDTGGADTVTLTDAELPAHDHSGDTATAGSHDHGGDTNDAGNHTHDVTLGSAGSHSHGGTSNSGGAHSHTITIHQVQGSPGSGGTAFGPDQGSSTHTSSVEPNHTHSDTSNSAGSHTHGGSTSSAGGHSHTITATGDHTHAVESTGDGDPHENRPPFLAMTYIIKI